jgi:hypothetical protein
MSGAFQLEDFTCSPPAWSTEKQQQQAESAGAAATRKPACPRARGWQVAGLHDVLVDDDDCWNLEAKLLQLRSGHGRD